MEVVSYIDVKTLELQEGKDIYYVDLSGDECFITDEYGCEVSFKENEFVKDFISKLDIKALNCEGL